MASVKNKGSQILSIHKFLTSNERSLLINQVNDELGVFYLSIIKYYAGLNEIKISINENHEYMGTEDNLFGQQEIKIFTINNTKKLNAALNSNKKKIIFSDYKNYKKYSPNYNSINGYKFEFDIVFFIRDELKIKNDELLLYCKNNPVLLFSEISKYLTNNQYSSDQDLVDEKNHILNIRKSIFENKKNNFSIKNLYLNIKKEAKYKKLSFLTY